LTEFFQQQLKGRPRLAEEHFVNAVRSANVDVLFITGMRDEAPVARLWHLVPDIRLVDVHVEASQKARTFRRQNLSSSDSVNHGNTCDRNTTGSSSSSNYRPSFTFDNNTANEDQVKAFANDHLVLFLSDGLQRMAGMVRSVPDFPKPGIEFRHVLDIFQQTEGVGLCTSLLKEHLAGDWCKVDAIVSCEAGGFFFAGSLAGSLALAVNLRLILVREAGKLPPPTISVERCSSHVSSHVNGVANDRIEMDANALRRGC
jgi:adenine/guanine phosphoribosyltransferase-like PRPP-binding protein